MSYGSGVWVICMVGLGVWIVCIVGFGLDVLFVGGAVGVMVAGGIVGVVGTSVIELNDGDGAGIGGCAIENARRCLLS